VQLLNASQHAPGQGLTGWHEPPKVNDSSAHPSGPVTKQAAVNGSQQVPVGHVVGAHAPGKEIGLEHESIGTEVQIPVSGSQHATGHGLGLQIVFAPSQFPPAVVHAAWVVTLHMLVAGSQHAPIGSVGPPARALEENARTTTAVAANTARRQHETNWRMVWNSMPQGRPSPFAGFLSRASIAGDRRIGHGQDSKWPAKAPGPLHFTKGHAAIQA